MVIIICVILAIFASLLAVKVGQQEAELIELRYKYDVLEGQVCKLEEEVEELIEEVIEQGKIIEQSKIK